MAATYGDLAIPGATYGGTLGATYGGEDVRTDRTLPLLGTASAGLRTGGTAITSSGVSGTARRNTWQ